jgi:hypothetical protein
MLDQTGWRCFSQKDGPGIATHGRVLPAGTEHALDKGAFEGWPIVEAIRSLVGKGRVGCGATGTFKQHDNLFRNRSSKYCKSLASDDYHHPSLPQNLRPPVAFFCCCCYCCSFLHGGTAFPQESNRNTFVYIAQSRTTILFVSKVACPIDTT